MDDMPWGYLSPENLEDVPALVQMMRQFFAPMTDEEIPEEKLEGLAKDLIAHFGDDGVDSYELIDSWVGDYMR